jgi:hypothetical protein
MQFASRSSRHAPIALLQISRAALQCFAVLRARPTNCLRVATDCQPEAAALPADLLSYLPPRSANTWYRQHALA